MTKRELIEALMSGKKMKAKGWRDGRYCFYDETYFEPFRFVDEYESRKEPMKGVWSYTDWEEYIEPSKKIDFINHILKTQGDNLARIINCLFANNDVKKGE